MGPPYVGIGSKQGGYPLCNGSVACCDVRSRDALLLLLYPLNVKNPVVVMVRCL